MIIGGGVQGSTKIIKDPDEISTMEGGTSATGGPGSSSINLNNEIMQERERLIKYNRAFIKKNKKIPTTTLDFYKFVKVMKPWKPNDVNGV
jgi:tRNA A-37 threonylcarbamoyl transferase component Bud32